MSAARSGRTTVRGIVSRGTSHGAWLLRLLVSAALVAVWSGFWLLIARLNYRQGEPVNAAFTAAVLVGPVVAGLLWRGYRHLGVDLPVSTPDVDLSVTSS